MQNAKDSFYGVLRDRVAAGNAARTVTVRGVVRPAVVVLENEVEMSDELLDCFVLRWGGLDVRTGGPAVVVGMGCEVSYATRGSAELGGLDKGRVMAAMDAELALAVSASPQTVVKENFSAEGAPAVMASRVWWSDAAWQDFVVDGELLRRKAAVTVWSYQEAGEV